ncbi:TetR/AcrR family transcriptional regulator [Levilactobacillus tongjiangensis]|uniref:TetR/AcrR family transcriptional regulator n=1 Tax=Levilactobacillus tongjiangensis TaxID=2486023 RepID=A0ABW1ST21_9LACO|nr:TetR/AcrR family transcriptional regulator [Levilactobacillus tongjiangensis]
MVNVLSRDQKSAKAQRIAAAAWQLFSQYSFNDISMTQLAETAGVAKGTLFNYYQTKESIFMTGLLTGYRTYLADLTQRLVAQPVHTPAELKAWLLTETRTLITDHSTLVRLNALRGPVLEGHADRQRTEQDRQALYTVNTQLGAVLAQQVPGLSVETAAHLFVIQSAIVSGLMNLAGLNQFDHQTLSADFPAFQINLEAEACRVFGYYLDGIFQEEIHGTI